MRAWITEQKQALQKRQDDIDPFIGNLLYAYYETRSAERETWSSVQQVKASGKDITRIESIMAFAKSHDIHRVSDLVSRLSAMEERVQHASDILHTNERRRKIIDKTKAAAAAIVRLKPIHDKYVRMGFKWQKDRYAEAHKDELDESRRAYAYLMKHHGEKLEVKPHEYDVELKQMEQADREAQTVLDSIHDDLEMLRKIRYCVSKVKPELVGEKRSLTDMIQESKEARHRQAIEQRNQPTNKWNVERSEEGR